MLLMPPHTVSFAVMAEGVLGGKLMLTVNGVVLTEHAPLVMVTV